MLEYQKKYYLEHFFPEIDKRGIKTIIHGGDLMDRRKFINFKTLEDSKNFFFRPALQRGIEIHVIAGNHDIYFKNTNSVNSPSLLLGEFPNFHPYWEPTELSLSGLDFLMVPWINQENFELVKKKVKDSKSQVCISHLELEGFEMYKGSVCSHGHEIPFLNKFKRVMTGHFHEPSEQGNIKYLGAPYPMTWGDYGCDRGFWILETNDLSLERVLNPIDLFIKINYNDELEKDMTFIESIDFKKFKNCYVKVQVEKKSNAFWFETMLEKILAESPYDLQISETLENNLSDKIIDIDVKGTSEILRESVELAFKDLKKEERVEIDSLLQSLYHEAMSET
jgi:DNA repair exonuclease SbcCD nuclease subunit